MAKKATDKKGLRKKAKKEIEDKISSALPELKSQLGPKKFRAAVKKARRAFLGKLKAAPTVKVKPAKTKLSAKKLSAVVAAPVK